MKLRSGSKTHQESRVPPKQNRSENKRRGNGTSRSKQGTKRVRRTVTSRAAAGQIIGESISSESPRRLRGPGNGERIGGKPLSVVRMKETELVNAMSVILLEICEANEKLDKTSKSILAGGPPYKSAKYSDRSSNAFYSVSRPSIMLRNYVARFVRYLNVSRSVFIVGLIYLDRVGKEDELLALRELNIHRLFTSSICVAAKYVEDESHRNSSLSKIGGVPSTEEMNALEVEFLRRLRWDCSVPMDIYDTYERTVVKTCERCSLANRGGIGNVPK